MMLAGYDTVDYSYASGGLTFSVSSSDTHRVTATGGGQGTDTLLNITHFIGSGYNDVFDVSGSAVTAYFEGGAGNDTLIMPGNASNYQIRWIGDGSVTITGGAIGQLASSVDVSGVEAVQFADQTLVLQISGTAGNDTLTGTDSDNLFDLSQGGNDTAYGLGGDDIFTMGAALNAADRIDGGAGTYDRMTISASGTMTLVCNATTITNIEQLALNYGTYNLTLNDGNVAAGQTLSITPLYIGNGGTISLTFDGSAEMDGNFYIEGSNGSFNVIGGGGNDIITASPYSAVAANISGGGGNDKIYGTSYNDVLNGGAGNDIISGGGILSVGNGDTVNGGSGNDTLQDCWGTLDGGSGTDTAVFSGYRSRYTITHNADGSYTVVDPTLTGCTARLTHIEKLQFIDQTLVIGSDAKSDANGDGYSDIFWQNDSGQAAIWTMNGLTQLDGSPVGGDPGSDWHVVAAGDFNGDGTADILWQNDNGQADIWTMNGFTQLDGSYVGGNPGASWHIMGTGDFNGDSKSDILWQNDSGQAAIWTMNGLTQLDGAEVGINPGSDWHVICAADFDGDGKSDILWQNDNGQAVIWLMDGYNVKEGSYVGGNPGADWHAVAAADFDGDGKADILWQNDNGQAAIWTMDGLTQTEGSPVGGNPGPNWHVIGAGDYNGDGCADILWQNDNGQAAIWTMNGLTQLDGSTVGGNPGTSWHVVT